MMIVSERTEQNEKAMLSPRAAHVADSKGRERPEEPCTIRTAYQRDRDRIVHCKSFRRLTHKTHVFLAPEGDHYRTRLTHTLEACGIPHRRPGTEPQRGPDRGDRARA